MIFLVDPKFVLLWSIDFCWYRVEWTGITLVCVRWEGSCIPCASVHPLSASHTALVRILRHSLDIRHNRFLLSLYFLNAWSVPLSSHHFSLYTFLGASYVSDTVLNSHYSEERLATCRPGDHKRWLSVTSKHYATFPIHEPEGYASLSLASPTKRNFRQK